MRTFLKMIKKTGIVKQRGVLLILLLFFILGWGFISLQGEDSTLRPITEFKLLSPVKEVNKAGIDEVMGAYLGSSFWGVNLNNIQADLTKLGWVYKAEVKRQWPNRLLVRIEEQKPVVLWGDTALLNKFGVVFYPKEINLFQDLVTLQGPQQNAKVLLYKLAKFQTQFSLLDWYIKKLTEQADGVWKIEFVQAPTLFLGQDNWQNRLERFIKAYPKVSLSVRKNAEQIDLRYSNGFVIKQNRSILEDISSK